jgi:hypothetical protein
MQVDNDKLKRSYYRDMKNGNLSEQKRQYPPQIRSDDTTEGKYWRFIVNLNVSLSAVAYINIRIFTFFGLQLMPDTEVILQTEDKIRMMVTIIEFKIAPRKPHTLIKFRSILERITYERFLILMARTGERKMTCQLQLAGITKNLKNLRNTLTITMMKRKERKSKGEMTATEQKSLVRPPGLNLTTILQII